MLSVNIYSQSIYYWQRKFFSIYFPTFQRTDRQINKTPHRLHSILFWCERALHRHTHTNESNQHSDSHSMPFFCIYLFHVPSIHLYINFLPISVPASNLLSWFGFVSSAVRGTLCSIVLNEIIHYCSSIVSLYSICACVCAWYIDLMAWNDENKHIDDRDKKENTKQIGIRKKKQTSIERFVKLLPSNINTI